MTTALAVLIFLAVLSIVFVIGALRAGAKSESEIEEIIRKHKQENENESNLQQ